MIRSEAVIPLSLVAGLLFQATAFAAFSDVPLSHPNSEAILYLQDAGIIEGYPPDYYFYPDQKINRAEFVKVLTVGLHLNQPAPTPLGTCTAKEIFPDVSRMAWYVSFTCTARRLGFIQGYPDGRCHGERSINFVEAAKILGKAFSLPTHTDEKIWYKGYVQALAERNAIPLSILSFDQSITRGEMAEIIWRLKAGVTTKDSQTYESLVRGNATQIYKSTEGWSLTYPSTWTVGPSPYEDAIEFSVPYPDGRKYVSNAWIDISTSVTCPTEEPGQGTVVQTITLGGHAFVATELADDAASGTLHHEIDFVSRLSPSKCLVLKKNIVVTGELRLTTQEQPLAAQEISAVQDTLKNVLKTLTISSSSNSALWRSYQETKDKYAIQYPANWTVQENVPLSSVDNSITVDGLGILFTAPDAEAHVFVAITHTCPDLSHNFQPTTNPSLGSVTINGRTFVSAHASDGAAGSVGEYMYYASNRDSTDCIVMVRYYFYSTGEANDEPIRSQVKQGIAEMENMLNQIVQSFTDI